MFYAARTFLPVPFGVDTVYPLQKAQGDRLAIQRAQLYHTPEHLLLFNHFAIKDFIDHAVS